MAVVPGVTFVPAAGAASEVGAMKSSTAWVTAALAATVALIVAAFVVVLRVENAPDQASWQTPRDMVGWGALMLAAAVTGWFVARAQPENRVGAMLAGGALCGATGAFADAWSSYALYTRPGEVYGGVAGEFGSDIGLWAVWVLLAVHLPLRFPTGEPMSNRWRWVGRAGTLAAVLCSVEIFHPNAFSDETAFADLPGVTNPIGIPGAGPVLAAVFEVGIYLLFAATFLAAASLFVRYRRSQGQERRQLKVVAVATVAEIVGLLAVANLMNVADGAPQEVLSVAGDLLTLVVPVSIGVAIVRHGLFGIDVIINRAIVYGALAAFITGVYVGVVVGIGAVVGSSEEPNLALSIVATAVVAVAFQPVRDRVQRIANRLVYGERATPYEVITTFSHRMADVLSPDEVLPRMAEAAGRGVGADAATIRLHLGDLVREASWPDGETVGDAPDLSLPIVHQGDDVGSLEVRKPRNEPITRKDRALLVDLASQAGLGLRNLGLTGELQRRLEELQASRQRLVAAQDLERRRIERDLHDGAQQLLIALKIKLTVASSAAEDEGANETAELLDEAARHAQEALQTLRDLTHGIYPQLLAERGLKAALVSQAAKSPIPVTVEGDIDRQPQEVEAALYFCCLEALQNIGKYAGASSATVRLSDGDGVLTFEVVDDGKGFDPATTPPGSGTQNMADRIDALGGSLTVTSAVGAGTTVRATVPVSSTAASAGASRA